MFYFMTIDFKKTITFFDSYDESKLIDQQFLEHFLIPKLGLNNEILKEQPKELSEYFGTGFGLKIWQYPNQFSKYLCLLSNYKHLINSYLEIGCRNGGTFFVHCQYLKPLVNAYAVDIIPESNTVKSFREVVNFVNYLEINSHSKEFSNFINNNFFDLIFIDGDHSYDGVKKDAETTRNNCNIQVFHDIVNDACPGVVKYWNELKKSYNDMYIFFEFVDQYESVDGNYLGIGVAIRKNWI